MRSLALYISSCNADPQVTKKKLLDKALRIENPPPDYLHITIDKLKPYIDS